MKTFNEFIQLKEGLGTKTKSGKYKPITPWKGSWAQQEEERRKKYNHENMKRDTTQIPMHAIPIKEKK